MLCLSTLQRLSLSGGFTVRLDLRSTGECMSSAGSWSFHTGGVSDVFGDTVKCFDTICIVKSAI